MPPAASVSRTRAWKPSLALFAGVGSIWVFILVVLGAFTTSINAGMAFPDWPLSNGSLNPKGWLSNIDMFAEHSHRLSAGVMTAVTLILAFWIWRTESRAWLRKLAYFAVGLVVAQAVAGGLRVLFDSQVIAMLHACLAQIFVCTLIAIAVACSRPWIETPVAAGAGVRRIGVLCCALLLVQLAIAAVMRHTFAGLAIPTFPLSTATGHLLPEVWSFKVAIHFAHRVMAVILTAALLAFVAAIWRSRAAPPAMRMTAAMLVCLLALQIFLGAQIIWTRRDPAVTTGHVLVGALTLATTFWLTWLAHRDAIEGASA